MGIKNFVNTYEYPINKIIISSPLLQSVFGILLLLVLIFKILNSPIISYLYDMLMDVICMFVVNYYYRYYCNHYHYSR